MFGGSTGSVGATAMGGILEAHRRGTGAHVHQPLVLLPVHQSVLPLLQARLRLLQRHGQVLQDGADAVGAKFTELVRR